MTKFISHIYNYILEQGLMSYIDKEAYREARQKSEKLSAALYTIMTETERNLLEEWQAAAHEANRMETEAIFTAAISLGKEFR